MATIKPPSATAVSPGTAAPPSPQTGGETITLYHWLVVLLAACGWLFDCMGQRIFVLSREPALRELLGAAASDDDVRRWGGIATFLLMIGWSTGGIFFGLISDRYGRVAIIGVNPLACPLVFGLSGFVLNR